MDRLGSLLKNSRNSLFNAMTVFYFKSAVLKAGGYEDFPAMEDFTYG